MLLLLLKTAVLARLLSPEAFGILSLVMIALGLTKALTETGINFTLLQSKDGISHLLNTAWTISMGRGVAIAGLMIVIGWAMQWYFKNPQLFTLTVIAALIPIIEGFTNPAIISLRKELRFFSDSAYRLVLTLTDVIASVLFVFFTQHITGVILGMLTAAGIQVLLSFILTKEHPRLHFDTTAAKAVFQNAKGLTPTAVLSYVQENVDSLMIGALSGTYILGLYDRGYALSHKALELSRAVFHSSVPVYTQAKEDQIRATFLKSSVGAMILVAVGILPLLFIPEFIIFIILGNQWLEVAAFLPYLGVAVWLQSLIIICRGLLISKRSYRYVNLQLVLQVMVLVGSILFFVPQWGALGAAWSIVLARIVSLPLILYGTFSFLND